MRDYPLPASPDDADQPSGDEQLTPFEAFVIIAAMQSAVDEVPSYVETRAIQTWIENSLEAQQ